MSCDNKSMNELKNAGRAFNFVSEEVSTEGESIYSMTGIYPDAIKCNFGCIFYLAMISDDKSSATYRREYPNGPDQIVFTNGGTNSVGTGSQISQCATKSMAQLISERRVFNFNYPVLLCPKDITAVDPVVNF